MPFNELSLTTIYHYSLFSPNPKRKAVVSVLACLTLTNVLNVLAFLSFPFLLKLNVLLLTFLPKINEQNALGMVWQTSQKSGNIEACKVHATFLITLSFCAFSVYVCVCVLWSVEPTTTT
ncbi:hypothetical protein S245_031041 [Arachis hypogaea]